MFLKILLLILANYLKNLQKYIILQFQEDIFIGFLIKKMIEKKKIELIVPKKNERCTKLRIIVEYCNSVLHRSYNCQE
jgi:hypothetical protein